jgi:catechol 2,3-dioxygenase-like lactoylglutathione lyase family enzyme
MTARLLAVQPVLEVRDVSAAIEFYARLGFTLAFRDDPAEPRYAGIRRDDVELHLQWHDAAEWARSPQRCNYRFLVQDVDALHAELSQQGYPFDMKPVSDTPWGTREFHLRDPDRNGLQFYRDL